MDKQIESYVWIIPPGISSTIVRPFVEPCGDGHSPIKKSINGGEMSCQPCETGKVRGKKMRDLDIGDGSRTVNEYGIETCTTCPHNMIPDYLRTGCAKCEQSMAPCVYGLRCVCATIGDQCVDTETHCEQEKEKLNTFVDDISACIPTKTWATMDKLNNPYCMDNKPGFESVEKLDNPVNMRIGQGNGR